MVAYTDISQVNTLYEEQARIDAGIALLDAGGLVSSFTVAPPPYVPPAPGDPIPPPSPTLMMSQTIATIDPPVELMTAARGAMLARHNAITTELTALGVTAPPAAL